MIEEQVVKRFSELANRAAGSGRSCRTNFIEPNLVSYAIVAARKASAFVSFVGGYESAERVIAVFSSKEVSQMRESLTLSEHIACVKVTFNPRFGSPVHPDFLGATLAIFNDRSVFGDIVITTGEAYLFMLSSVASTVAMSLTSVGRTSVKAEIHDYSSGIPMRAADSVTLRDTVPSLRLDALVASAYKLSRSEAQSAILSVKVKLNHAEETRTDVNLKIGDLISIRGQGRAVLQDVIGENKKGRIIVIFSKTAITAQRKR